MKYAGFWRRFGAFCIDAVVILPLVLITVFLGKMTKLTQLYMFIPELIFSLWFQ